MTRALSGDAPTLPQEVQRTLHAHPAISPTLILVAAWITFTVINPRFLQPGALSLLVQQTAIVAILAVGQTLILLTAGIDLSVGAVCVLAAMVMAKITSEQGVPGVLAILIGIAVAMAAGLLNGILVTRLKLPPFIVTLGTLSIFTAIALLYSKGATIESGVLPGELNSTGHTWSVGAFRITAGVLLVLLVYVVVGVALRKTAWGRHVYAVGDDAQAAGLAGVRVGRVLLSVYVVAGVIYGIGAWVMIGRVGGASPNAVVDANLESITAVVIGGTSLFGGRGGLLGTLLGALIVQSFSVGLALAGVDGQFRLLAVGILVILAVSVDQWIRQVKA